MDDAHKLSIPPAQHDGFEIVNTQHIADISSRVTRYHHTATDAEIISVENDDDNCAFAVALKTPPPDDTGLPHILEHSVLNGSKKYPVKEPFVELLKSSLASFVNAMTFDDMTIYPVASTNEKDLHNLIQVYLDAVFHPLITRETFSQEGWHYKPTDDGQLMFQGVVYNEMKGYYSVPDIMLERYVDEALLADTAYAFSSGGDPQAIPTLTYDDFVNFHSTYYHPSNARFFFYGNDDPKARLEIIADLLNDFDYRQVDSSIALQSAWDAPKTIERTFEAGEQSTTASNYLTVTWLLTHEWDSQERFRLALLERVLTGLPASPLRFALTDADMGDDVIASLDEVKQQMTYTVGVKGVDESNISAVETLIFDTLVQIVADGIDPLTVEAAINSAEFAQREKNTGRFPRGLVSLIEIAPSWMHGGDPVEALRFEQAYQQLRNDVENDKNYFVNMIKKYLIDNQHRLTLVMRPDTEFNLKLAEGEAESLKAARQNMSDDEFRMIGDYSTTLQQLQTQPDDPNAIASLPMLNRNDLTREIDHVDTDMKSMGEATLFWNDISTNNIAYVDFAFDMRSVPPELVPYISLYMTALTDVGTETRNYVRLSQDINAKIGGFDVTSVIQNTYVRENPFVAYLMMRLKALPSQLDSMVELFEDVLHHVDFHNRSRVRQIVLELKSSQEAYLSLRGHMDANYRLNAQTTPAGWLQEQISGPTQLQFLRTLLTEIDSNWADVLDKLTRIHELVTSQPHVLVNITADEEVYEQVATALHPVIERIQQGEHTVYQYDEILPKVDEGLGIPSQINFVGMASNMYDAGYKRNGSYITIAKHMNLTYMWNMVRVQGGAYGGTMLFDPTTGQTNFLSWQDPNIGKTIDVYQNAGRYLSGIELDQDEIERAVIGGISTLDDALLPDAKGYRAFIRHLIGLTDDMRQQIRDEVLNTSIDDFHTFGRYLAQATDDNVVVVAGDRSRLEAFSQESGRTLDIVPLG